MEYYLLAISAFSFAYLCVNKWLSGTWAMSVVLVTTACVITGILIYRLRTSISKKRNSKIATERNTSEKTDTLENEFEVALLDGKLADKDFVDQKSAKNKKTEKSFSKNIYNIQGRMIVYLLKRIFRMKTDMRQQQAEQKQLIREMEGYRYLLGIAEADKPSETKLKVTRVSKSTQPTLQTVVGAEKTQQKPNHEWVEQKSSHNFLP